MLIVTTRFSTIYVSSRFMMYTPAECYATASPIFINVACTLYFSLPSEAIVRERKSGMDSPLHLSENCQLIIASDACLSQHRRWANIVRRNPRTNLLHLSNSAWQIDDHHYQTGRPAPLIPFCSSTLGLELVWPSFPRPLSFG